MPAGRLHRQDFGLKSPRLACCRDQYFTPFSKFSKAFEKLPHSPLRGLFGYASEHPVIMGSVGVEMTARLSGKIWHNNCSFLATINSDASMPSRRGKDCDHALPSQKDDHFPDHYRTDTSLRGRSSRIRSRSNRPPRRPRHLIAQHYSEAEHRRSKARFGKPFVGYWCGRVPRRPW